MKVSSTRIFVTLYFYSYIVSLFKLLYRMTDTSVASRSSAKNSTCYLLQMRFKLVLVELDTNSLLTMTIVNRTSLS
jgi:hypothetical protein